MRAILFDLDGTLIDSKLDIVNSVNAMLRATRREEMSIETVASYIGHGAPRLIASVLGVESTESERAAALNIFLEHYRSITWTLRGPIPVWRMHSRCCRAIRWRC